MPREVYAKDFYPPFCHGAMIISSIDHIRELYKLSLVTDHEGFYLEDILIFGILRHKTQSDRFQAVPYGYGGRVKKSQFDGPLVHHMGPFNDITKHQSKMMALWNRSVRELLRIGKIKLNYHD